MDVVEFFKEKERMCKSYGDTCDGCGMSDEIDGCGDLTSKEAKIAVEIVEKWSKEHPVMTNAEKFKEVFGVEPKLHNGAYIGVCFMRTIEECERVSSCKECKKWWDAEYEEPKESE